MAALSAWLLASAARASASFCWRSCGRCAGNGQFREPAGCATSQLHVLQPTGSWGGVAAPRASHDEFGPTLNRDQCGGFATLDSFITAAVPPNTRTQWYSYS